MPKYTSNQKGATALVMAAVIAGIFITGAAFYTHYNKDQSIQKNVTIESTSPNKGTGAVKMMLNTDKKTVVVGETFVMQVLMDTQSATVSATQLKVKFNQQHLEVTKIEKGQLLSIDLIPGSIKDGEAVITLGSSPNSPVKGTGTVALVTFKALKPIEETLVSLEGQVAALGLQGNQVGVTERLNITIK